MKVTNLSPSNISSKSSNELFSKSEVQLNSTTMRNNRYEGNLLVLRLLSYLSGIFLRMKFVFFQKYSNLFLLLNISTKLK